eukprot:RCo049052
MLLRPLVGSLGRISRPVSCAAPIHGNAAGQHRKQQQNRPARILVGLSASAYGDAAVRAALRVGRAGDTVVGVYAPPILPRGYDDAPANVRDSFLAYREEIVKEVLQRAKQISEVNPPVAAFTTKVMAPIADTKAALVSACLEEKADLLVIGARGRSTARAEGGSEAP